MDVSVVIPLLNEEESLPELVERLDAALTGRDYELIFIDDGSTDGSFELLKRLRERNGRITAVRFRRNYGKAAALATGFARARGEVVITMDADLQDDPAEIPELTAKIEEGYDLVSGWKFDRHDPFFGKKIPSKVWNGLVSRMTGLKIHDFNCGLKAYRNDVIKEIDIYGDMHRYTPALAHLKGFRVTEKKVTHHARKHGVSKYGMGRFMRGILDLMTVIFLSRYRMRPLHLFGSGGMFLFGAGCLIDLYILSLRIRFGNIQEHGPLMLAGILLTILGIQFISTGLIAELITGLNAGKAVHYSIREELA